MQESDLLPTFVAMIIDLLYRRLATLEEQNNATNTNKDNDITRLKNKSSGVGLGVTNLTFDH